MADFKNSASVTFPAKLQPSCLPRAANFACPFCHNGSLIPLRTQKLGGEVPESEILDYLRQRQGKLQGVVITGGEPTIHQDLPQFIALVKQMGYAVKLDTNGSNPMMIERLLLDDLVDCIAMDIKARWAAYERLTGTPIDVQRIRRSMQLIANSEVDHIFRTTMVPGLHGPHAEARIRAQLPEDSELVIQECNIANALDPATCRGEQVAALIN